MENPEERRPKKQMIQYVTPEGGKFWIETEINYKVGLAIADSSDDSKDVVPVLHYTSSCVVVPSPGTVHSDAFIPTRYALWSVTNLALQCQKELKKIMKRSKTLTELNLLKSTDTSGQSQSSFENRDSTVGENYAPQCSSSPETKQSQGIQKQRIFTKAYETTGFLSKANQSSYSKISTVLPKSKVKDDSVKSSRRYRPQNNTKKRNLTMAEEDNLEISASAQPQRNSKRRMLRIADGGSTKFTTEEQPKNNVKKDNSTILDGCVLEFSTPKQPQSMVKRRMLKMSDDGSIKITTEEQPQRIAKRRKIRIDDDESIKITTEEQPQRNAEKKKLSMVKRRDSEFSPQDQAKNNFKKRRLIFPEDDSIEYSPPDRPQDKAKNRILTMAEDEHDLPVGSAPGLPQRKNKKNSLKMTGVASPEISALEQFQKDNEIIIARTIEGNLPDISVSDDLQNNAKRKFRILAEDNSKECFTPGQSTSKNKRILTIAEDVPPKLFTPHCNATHRILSVNEDGSTIINPTEGESDTVNGDDTENIKNTISSPLFALYSDESQSRSSSSFSDIISSILEKEYPTISNPCFSISPFPELQASNSLFELVGIQCNDEKQHHDAAQEGTLSDAAQIRIPSPSSTVSEDSLSNLLKELQMNSSVCLNTAASPLSTDISMSPTTTPEATDVCNEQQASKSSSELLETSCNETDRHDLGNDQEKVQYHSSFNAQLSDATQSRIPSIPLPVLEDELYNLLEEFEAMCFEGNTATSPTSTQITMNPTTTPEEADMLNEPQASKSSVQLPKPNCGTVPGDEKRYIGDTISSVSLDESGIRTPSPFSAITEDMISGILEEFAPISFSSLYASPSPPSTSSIATEVDSVDGVSTAKATTFSEFMNISSESMPPSEKSNTTENQSL